MYRLNDVLMMKKPHACGGNAWKVVRVGADVKLQCSTCGKFVNVMRAELEKRLKMARENKNEEME